MGPGGGRNLRNARNWETCTLCIVLYPTFVIKISKRALKFNFLFVVPQMIKNEQVTQVYSKMGSQTTLSILREGCRLCKHCGCMLNTDFTQVPHHWPARAAYQKQEINFVSPKIVPSRRRCPLVKLSRFQLCLNPPCSLQDPTEHIVKPQYSS